MGLIDCPDCGAKVSDQAPACAKCGRPSEAAAPQRVTTSEDSALTRNRGLGDIVLLLIVLGAIGWAVDAFVLASRW